MRGKRIVLGITGGIAAYKAVEVCRRLVDAGAHVIPVMTPDAKRFVGEVTFSALASEPVQSSIWNGSDPIPHTTLGQSADLVLVAPATARLIGNYTAGISEGLLTATLLATEAPVVVCPAMHTEMWNHPAVQENLATLIRRGVHVVPPEEGRLAGGDTGSGRLAAPPTIVEAVARVLSDSRDCEALRVLVTAGGTREPIDSVRVISNRSSGKQGYAIAAEAAARGAEVTLVTTVDRAVPAGVAEVVHVATAAEMQQAVMPRSADQDVVVMAAAVADFRPKLPSTTKLKKSDGAPQIAFEPTEDILVGLGENKPVGQTLVGFAAETDDVVANAKAKLDAKKLDLIVANDVSADGVGFEHDTNEVHLVTALGVTLVPLADKRAIAGAVLDHILETRSRSVDS